MVGGPEVIETRLHGISTDIRLVGSDLRAWHRLWADDEQTGLRPESCWNDCLTRTKLIRPCAPSHVAYEVGAARQQTVRSPRTMDPHSQEWHRNREATVYLPA